MSDTSVHHKTATASSLSYSVRRMRNTAVLVKWIEDHQSNPYPTKAEKQYLAYYSGMNLTQLSTWFANARRRIKKIGMKTWLEGRSTFSLDYFPSPIQRPSDSFTGGGSYTGLASTSPYAAAAYSPLATGLHSSYPPHQHSALGMAGSVTGHMTNGLSYDTGLQPSSTTTSPLGSLYGMSSQARSSMMGLGMPTLPMAQWPSTPILSSTPVSFPSLQSRPSSGNAAPLHSPLTAQVYTADATTASMQLRSHSAQSIDVGDTTYTLQQPSPDQMLPECASTEPVNSILTDHKGATALQN